MMVDLDYLKKIKLVSRPIGQRIVAIFLLHCNYRIFADVDIRIENIERIPRNENVIFAMNHTDRFNYWPFQYMLWRKRFPFTTVWVKGKYYGNALLAKGLDLCNLIPVPTMGYLVEEFYRKKCRKRLDRDVYRDIKDVVDGRFNGVESYPRAAKEVLRALGENFVDFVRSHYDLIMERVAELSRSALFEKDLNLIIFPEGTRGPQLGEGKTGLAQLALHTEKKIVPVGCNNSDTLYTGSLPFAKSGVIIYRVGEPLSVDDRLREFRIGEPFKLFSRESQEKYRRQFEQVTEIVMESINRLLDERYRRAFVGS
ncbi:MAG: 1-acyl-sn-glycerol-3-phosphate acyltransferase [Deltaproteobacteria bacterium]|nr:1-acyl-sn-glycerol-3-phosphate acyltransferase [Deltaproteobacteria bacterium]